MEVSWAVVFSHLIICQMEKRIENRRKSNYCMLQKCYDICCLWMLKHAKYNENPAISIVVTDYGSEGYRFNSCQVRHLLADALF